MIYRGSCKDINDDVIWVEIHTPTPAEEGKDINIDLILGTPPVIINYEGGDIIYKPIKASSATIKIITKEHYTDLYSPIPHRNEVLIKRDHKTIQQGLEIWTQTVLWQGFITPSAYNLSWDGDYTEFEIEAIDCLATLKYFKYESEDKKMISFYDIIKKLILKMGGKFTYLNVSYNKSIVYQDGTTNESNPKPLLKDLYISLQNFFDEDGEPMECKEVLEQICQYLNLTCYTEGNEVWMVDYDEIKAGAMTYEVYNLHSDTHTYKNISSPFRNITKVDYMSNDNSISLDKVYNKVKVKDSFYSFDTIFPSLWDEHYIHTYPVDERTDINLMNFKIPNKDGEPYTSYIKYYKNENCTTYSYKKNEPFTAIVNAIPSWNLGINMITAGLIESDVKKGNNQLRNDLSFKKYLGIMVHDAPSNLMKPVFKMDIPLNKDTYLMQNAYLIFKGTITYQNIANTPVSASGYAPSQEGDYGKKDLLYLPVEIKYGKYWWQARDDFMGGNWVTTKTITKIPLDYTVQKDTKGNYLYIEHFLNVGFPIMNNINWRDGLEGEGYKIPVPKDLSPTDRPSVILYNPQNPSKLMNDSPVRHIHSVWVENFEVQTQVPTWSNDSANKNSDEDTEYSNVVNEDYVEELKDIEYKVCTYDNKKANYSSVFYIEKDGIYTPLKLLKQGYSGKSLISEQHTIERIVNQYSEPSRILNVRITGSINSPTLLPTDISLKTVCTFSTIYEDKKFIIDSMAIDYERNTKELILVEKK